MLYFHTRLEKLVDFWREDWVWRETEIMGPAFNNLHKMLPENLAKLVRLFICEAVFALPEAFTANFKILQQQRNKNCMELIDPVGELAFKTPTFASARPHKRLALQLTWWF